jgi:hypothetical protein
LDRQAAQRNIRDAGKSTRPEFSGQQTKAHTITIAVTVAVTIYNKKNRSTFAESIGCLEPGHDDF